MAMEFMRLAAAGMRFHGREKIIYPEFGYP
jgi:hypothetical protein